MQIIEIQQSQCVIPFDGAEPAIGDLVSFVIVDWAMGEVERVGVVQGVLGNGRRKVVCGEAEAYAVPVEMLVVARRAA